MADCVVRSVIPSVVHQFESQGFPRRWFLQSGLSIVENLRQSENPPVQTLHF
jgi:hypothetical protein